jgi:hypothetical protein
MINNTTLYNLANYETLHAEWEKDVNDCRVLCVEQTCPILFKFVEAEYMKNNSTNYHVSEMWDAEFDRVHRENWVTPVILLNNEMFRKSHNPNVNHLVEAGLNGLRGYLTIPPEDDQDRYEILEYIEKMQPIMENYKIAMNDLKKRMETALKNI